MPTAAGKCRGKEAMSEAGRYSPDGALLLTAQSSSSSICCIAVPSRPSARCTCSGSRRNRAIADDGIMHANVAWGCRGTSGAGKKGSPAANMALSSCATKCANQRDRASAHIHHVYDTLRESYQCTCIERSMHEARRAQEKSAPTTSGCRCGRGNLCPY